jgi:hypothetical protein
VALADLEVGLVVRRGDLQRSGPEVALDGVVGDHRHGALGERDAHAAADQRREAGIVRVDRHRDVGEDRLGPHRRDLDRAHAVDAAASSS